MGISIGKADHRSAAQDRSRRAPHFMGDQPFTAPLFARITRLAPAIAAAPRLQRAAHDSG
jgi:hypothetical protein